MRFFFLFIIALYLCALKVVQLIPEKSRLQHLPTCVAAPAVMVNLYFACAILQAWHIDFMPLYTLLLVSISSLGYALYLVGVALREKKWMFALCAVGIVIGIAGIAYGGYYIGGELSTSFAN